jgi:hypothetical protein
MDYLTKEQVDGFVEIFDAFDTSGDGTVRARCSRHRYLFEALSVVSRLTKRSWL